VSERAGVTIGTEPMMHTRRKFLHVAAGAAVLAAAPRLAWAQAYPARPVRIIVPFGPGGGGDIVTRLIGQWLADRLNQPFVIENRPGAATNIAVETLVRAPPDGYTLLLAASANAVNATLYEHLNFNFIRDTVPVASTNRVPFVMLVNPAVPVRTIPEFIAYAKANPGKINIASTGNGLGPHMDGVLFQQLTGVEMVDVPYRGGDAPALTDLLGGRVQVYFATMIGSIQQIRAGKLRALGVTTAARQPQLPDLPAVGEFVPGYEGSGWNGIVAPRGTPPEIIDKLNSAINAGLADPGIKGRMIDLGAPPLAGTPADFGWMIAEETEKWGRVIRAGNIQPE
jgi:tripartite-type tricarboxylate transporter receptor subunit TctC